MTDKRHITNQILKAAIADCVMDEEELNQIIVLEGDEFADGCVGISDDNHLIYSYERLVESLSSQTDMTEEEAMEWLDYNTIRSLPYMHSDGYEPIIIHELPL